MWFGNSKNQYSTISTSFVINNTSKRVRRARVLTSYHEEKLFTVCFKLLERRTTKRMSRQTLDGYDWWWLEENGLAVTFVFCNNVFANPLRFVLGTNCYLSQHRIPIAFALVGGRLMCRFGSKKITPVLNTFDKNIIKTEKNSLKSKNLTA